MPLEARQAYEQIASLLVDKNGNGIPDFLEGDIIKNISSFYTAAKSINYNGNVYSNVNDRSYFSSHCADSRHIPFAFFTSSFQFHNQAFILRVVNQSFKNG